MRNINNQLVTDKDAKNSFNAQQTVSQLHKACVTGNTLKALEMLNKHKLSLLQIQDEESGYTALHKVPSNMY